MLSQELQALKEAGLRATASLRDVEAARAVLQDKLQQRDWAIRDITAVKDARCSLGFQGQGQGAAPRAGRRPPACPCADMGSPQDQGPGGPAAHGTAHQEAGGGGFPEEVSGLAPAGGTELAV